MTPDEVADAIMAALERGDVIVHHTRCWSCMTDQCPGGPHGWAGPEDIEHAKATGQPDPSEQTCGCPCVDGPELDPQIEPPPEDLDEISLTTDPCPLCGATGACATDPEGRPLIHALTDEEDS